MCLLVVIVAGAVESGPLKGVDYSVPLPFAFLAPHFVNQTLTYAHKTTTQASLQTSSGTTEISGGLGTAVGIPTLGSPGPLGSPQALLSLLSLYLVIPAICVLGVALAIVLARKEDQEVFDFRSAIEEMQNQRTYFLGSWSDRLRNAALLRYYLLMVRVCSKAGMDGKPEETPREFVFRVSSTLHAGSGESARFANTVDRAHYGAELTESEIDSASQFMDSFTKGLMKLVG